MMRERKDEHTQNELEREQAEDPEAKLNDQDPGHRQKENQNKQKDDPLAA